MIIYMCEVIMNNTYINWLNQHLKNQSLLNEINWAAVNKMRGAVKEPINPNTTAPFDPNNPFTAIARAQALRSARPTGGLASIGSRRIQQAVIGAAQRARGTALVGTPAGGMRTAAATRAAQAQAKQGATSQDIQGLTQAIKGMGGGGGGSPTAQVTQQDTGSTARGQNIPAVSRVTSSQKPGTRPITGVTESLSNIVNDMIIKKINVRK